MADFFPKVYDIVCKIPRGRVSTYGAIAEFLGMKSSARLVGMALKKLKYYPQFHNIVPAHRVVNRNGILTGKNSFSPPELMEKLLAEEGVLVENDKVINFENIFWDPNKEL